MRTAWPCTILVAAALGLLSPHATGDDGPRALRTGDAEIAALIRDLGHPSYGRRSQATRLLCAAGMAAYEPLRAAARSDDVETALRARDILTTLDRLMFSGVDLALELSATKTAWDGPVQLALKMVNRSDHPAHVPFQLDSGRRAELPDHARQVADMIDLAEWLTVRGPDGEEVQLRVNDITMDEAVEVVVAERVTGGPTSTLAPGQQAMVVAAEFNRGWARYPLLDAGRYTLAFDYEPAWEDPMLAEQRVGRVQAAPVSIDVHRAAPEAVSRRGEEASLRLVRKHDVVVAQLTNHSDQALKINKNLGPVPPFAQGRWIGERGADVVDIAASAGQPRSWVDFDQTLLVEVPPGGTAELVTLDIADLSRKIAGRRAEVAGAYEVYFTYSNLCDRRWQVRQGALVLGNEEAPPILRQLLPPELRALWKTSNRITINLGD